MPTAIKWRVSGISPSTQMPAHGERLRVSAAAAHVAVAALEEAGEDKAQHLSRPPERTRPLEMQAVPRRLLLAAVDAAEGVVDPPHPLTLSLKPQRPLWLQHFNPLRRWD